MALEPGKHAPDFSLLATPDQRLGLRDFRRKPLALFFYPADWSPVCGDQVALYNELLPEFRKLGYPLLSDFEPKGAVARAYDVYRPGEGVSERACFVIDGEGVIRWSYVSPIGVNPGADGFFEALENLKGKKA